MAAAAAALLLAVGLSGCGSTDLSSGGTVSVAQSTAVPTSTPTLAPSASAIPTSMPTVTVTVTAPPEQKPSPRPVVYKDCDDFSSKSDARDYLKDHPAAAGGMDSDGDGKPCENKFKPQQEPEPREDDDEDDWEAGASAFLAKYGGSCDGGENGAPICESNGMIYDPGDNLSECDEFFVAIDAWQEFDDSDAAWALENCGVDLYEYNSP